MAQVVDGKYMIMNAASRTVIDLDGGNKNNGTKVQGWEVLPHEGNDTTKHQIWQIKCVESDGNKKWWTIMNEGTGTYIDLAGGDLKNKAKIHAWEKANNDNQKWMFFQTPNSTIKSYLLYSKVSAHTQKWRCMDLDGGNKSNGTNVQLYEAGDAGTNNNQVWMLIKLD